MGNIVDSLCSRTCNDGQNLDETIRQEDLIPEEVRQRDPNECFNELFLSEVYLQPDQDYIKLNQQMSPMQKSLNGNTTTEDSLLSKKNRQIHNIEQSSLINNNNGYFWALKFAETFRLDVAEQVEELCDQTSNIENMLEGIRINVIDGMGLNEGSEEHLAFCKSVASYQQQPNNQVSKILNDVQNGLENYIKYKNVTRAVHIMNIHEDFEDMPQRLYYYIMFKVYALVRYELYNEHQKYKEDNKHFNLDDSFNSVPDNLREDLVNKIDFIQIFEKVLDIFGIDYYSVNQDAELMMRKLQYVSLFMPPLTQEKEQMKFEIDCLIEANPYMTDLILKNNQYVELQNQPLDGKQLTNEWFGAPQVFQSIYNDIYEQMVNGNFTSYRNNSRNQMSSMGGHSLRSLPWNKNQSSQGRSQNGYNYSFKESLKYELKDGTSDVCKSGIFSGKNTPMSVYMPADWSAYEKKREDSQENPTKSFSTII